MIRFYTRLDELDGTEGCPIPISVVLCSGAAYTSDTLGIGLLAGASTAPNRIINMFIGHDFHKAVVHLRENILSSDVNVLHVHVQTPPALLAEHDVVLAAILNKCEIKQGQYAFDIPTVANSIGVTTTYLSNQLLSLKLKGEVTYELKDQAYCYTIVEIPADLCSLSAHLTKWLTDIESCKVFLQGNSQAKFTPGAVARIMHGIASQVYPSTIWSKTRFWGRYTQIDFPVIVVAAKAELINFVRKDAI